MKSIEGTPNVNFMIRVSMLEIYNEEVVDLLEGSRKKKLQIHEEKENGAYVKGLEEFQVTNV
jgi:kinesin family protein 3/17